MPNAQELAALTGSVEPASAQALLDAVGAVVVTAGSGGASWVDRSGIVHVPAAPADQVDTTGAGDAFNAGVLAAWLSGLTTTDALHAGVRLGAQVVTRVGAQPARPPRRYDCHSQSPGSNADTG